MKLTKKTVALIAAAVAAPIAVFAAAEHTVTQKNKAFSQPEITVKAGESITFSNDDEVVHNVFSSTKGLEFDLKTQQPGGSSTIKFDKPGQLEVRCAIHPKMKLKVNVKD